MILHFKQIRILTMQAAIVSMERFNPYSGPMSSTIHYVDKLCQVVDCPRVFSVKNETTKAP